MSVNLNLSKPLSTTSRLLAEENSQLQVTDLFNVRGWVAVVTGGGTGLGLVTAKALIANGAKVYITGRRLEPLQAAAEGSEGKIVPIQADVSTKEGILKLKEAIEAKEQWINLLVNNHGISLGSAKIGECEQTPEAISKHMFEGESFEFWLEHYRINAASYHFTSFAFLPLLAAAKSAGGAPEAGNIINVSSISGRTLTSQRGQFGYNASKAATIAISHMQATEFARRGLGVRVNTIAPGYFPSGMSVMDPGQSAETFRSKWGIPFGRPGNSVDYSQTVLSVATNQYMTGAEIVVDGGWLLESAF